MARPINQRLHVETIAERTSLFAARGAMLALMATVHNDIEPALIAKRQADDLLDRCVRSWHEKQGYSISADAMGGKYYGQGHAFGTLEPSLATANNPFAGLLRKGMDRASVETYQASK